MALKEFSTEELYYVLDANHSKEISNRFGKERTALLDSQVPPQPKQKSHILSRSLFAAITEGPSCSIVILWSIIGLVSLNILTLTMLTLCFAVILLITGAMFYYGTHNELTRENKRSVKHAHLAELKLICANEIFRRQKNVMKKRNISPLTIADQLFIYKPEEKPAKNMMAHMKKALGATLMITPTLFGTYYFAASGILGAFGLTALAAFMTGPVGIGLAIVASLAVGIFFGYKLYKSCKQEESFNRRFKKISHEYDYKRKLCYEQKSKLQQSKTLKQPDPVEHKNLNPQPCGIRYARMPILLLNKTSTNRRRVASSRSYYSKKV